MFINEKRKKEYYSSFYFKNSTKIISSIERLINTAEKSIGGNGLKKKKLISTFMNLF